MMLECVSKFGTNSDIRHAVFVPGRWPTDSVNDRAAVCGMRTRGGWELHNGADANCDLCLMILKGHVVHAVAAMRSRDVAVPPMPDTQVMRRVAGSTPFGVSL